MGLPGVIEDEWERKKSLFLSLEGAQIDGRGVIEFSFLLGLDHSSALAGDEFDFILFKSNHHR